MKSAAEELYGKYFPVLDHGFVSLVDSMGDDRAIEQAARVSYGKGTRKRSLTTQLIRYLMRHRHTTPFEMVTLKFHCAMPIFVARQWIRHRTASVNEYSGRYSLMPMVFYTPDEAQFCKQSANNKQGRGEKLGSVVWENAVGMWNAGRALAEQAYTKLDGDGVAREISRIDLPTSTYTQWYWQINLHNLFHFLELRIDPHAQWEIRQFAEIMAGMVEKVCPIAYAAWLDYRVNSHTFSAQDISKLKQTVDFARLDEMSGPLREAEALMAKLNMSLVVPEPLDLNKAKPTATFKLLDPEGGV